MARNSLSAYQLRIKRTSDDMYMPMTKFDGSNDFFDVLSDYLNRIHKTGVRANLAREEVFRINRAPAANGRRVFGAIESGDYGDESPVVDISSNTTRYTKTINDALLRPYYFSFYVTKNSNVSVVLLQRYKQFGMQSIFIGDLQNWFRINHPSYVIEFDYVVASNFIEQVIRRGSIRSLHFYRYGIPSDIADEYDQGYQEVDGYIELVFKSKGRGFPLKQKLLNLVSGNNPTLIGGAFVFKDALEGFDYNGFKVIVEDGSKQRTINFTNLDAIRADYSLDEDVMVVRTVPVFEEVDRYADSLTRDLLQNLGLI